MVGIVAAEQLGPRWTLLMTRGRNVNGWDLKGPRSEVEVQVVTAEREQACGGAGLLVELAPGERHEVVAAEDARPLPLLTPWPGRGHAGPMTIREELYARLHAPERAGQANRS